MSYDAEFSMSIVDEESGRNRTVRVWLEGTRCWLTIQGSKTTKLLCDRLDLGYVFVTEDFLDSIPDGQRTWVAHHAQDLFELGLNSSAAQFAQFMHNMKSLQTEQSVRWRRHNAKASLRLKEYRERVQEWVAQKSVGFVKSVDDTWPPSDEEIPF